MDISLHTCCMVNWLFVRRFKIYKQACPLQISMFLLNFEYRSYESQNFWNDPWNGVEQSKFFQRVVVLSLISLTQEWPNGSAPIWLQLNEVRTETLLTLHFPILSCDEETSENQQSILNLLSQQSWEYITMQWQLRFISISNGFRYLETLDCLGNSKFNRFLLEVATDIDHFKEWERVKFFTLKPFFQLNESTGIGILGVKPWLSPLNDFASTCSVHYVSYVPDYFIVNKWISNDHGLCLINHYYPCFPMFNDFYRYFNWGNKNSQ